MTEECMNEERDDILEALPRRSVIWSDVAEPGNAHVYIDTMGRLNIMLKNGGWLGIEPKNFQHVLADIAPFAG